jgi:hypothetical protein
VWLGSAGPHRHKLGLVLLATTKFYVPVLFWLNRAIFVIVLVVELVAFVNCLLQRAEAFPVVGSVPKGGWLAITGAAIVFTFLLSFSSIIGIIAVAAALVYLLDTRPALKEASGGSGPW